MLTLLRVVGTLNAAVWFGAAIFFTFAAAPAFFSDTMIQLLGRPHAGAAAQVVLERYFMLQHWCGVIALTHLGAEWLYAGRSIRRLRLGLLLTIFALGLAGDLWLLPKLKRLHLDMYGARSTPEQRESARKTFGLWHGVAQGANLLVVAGLLVYFWQVSQLTDWPHLSSKKKFEDKFRG
jgi:hypothetical protein